MKIEVEGFRGEIRRVVVKLGTKQITDLKQVNFENIGKIAREVVKLRAQGLEFILTVSGAIGLGVHEYQGDKTVDKLSIPEKQALAGMGQVRLMEVFKNEFAKHHIAVGQVLLTHAIFDNRRAYLNARNTLNTMLEMGMIPVINENDSVAVEEIKFGDNDRLGALVTLLTDSDLYIMLSDIDGFYVDYDNENRRMLKVVNIDEEPALSRHAGKRAETFSSGGMKTKFEAARMTNLSCVPSVIANGFKQDIISKVLNNIEEGTIFISDRCNLNYKKRWISARKPKGRIIVDAGAAEALRNHKSLLASGIKGVEGSFKDGDGILIVDTENNEVAIGLTNYTASELKLIAGKKSHEIEDAIGHKNRYSHVVHVDNMVLF